MDDYQLFTLGDWVLAGGGMLPDAVLAYKTHGTLNAARDNAIIFPTHYGGTHVNNEWLIGEGKALDPQRFFSIITQYACQRRFLLAEQHTRAVRKGRLSARHRPRQRGVAASVSD